MKNILLYLQRRWNQPTPVKIRAIQIILTAILGAACGTLMLPHDLPELVDVTLGWIVSVCSFLSILILQLTGIGPKSKDNGDSKS